MTRQAYKFNPKNVSENEIYKFVTSHWQHQNQLSWSRLYVLLALEFAVLGGAFSTRGLVGIGAVIVGTFVGFIIYCLMKRDWIVRDQHLQLLDKVHSPLGISMKPTGGKFSNGEFFLNTLFLTLLVTNVAVLAVLTALLWQKTGSAALIAVSATKCNHPTVHTDSVR